MIPPSGQEVLEPRTGTGRRAARKEARATNIPVQQGYGINGLRLAIERFGGRAA